MKVGFNRWARFHRTHNKFQELLGINFTQTGGYHFDNRRELKSLRRFELKNRVDFLICFQKSIERYSSLSYYGC